MMMVSAAVATGVRNDAAPATVRAIMNGSTDTCRSAASTVAIGTMISTVAVFEISWPSTTVSTQIARRPAA